MTEVGTAQTTLPEHVANFAWATSLQIVFMSGGSHVAYYKRGDYLQGIVPELESPAWRQAVMDGLVAKDYQIVITHGESLEVSLKLYPSRRWAAMSDTLNAALNAACTKAREAQG